MYRRLLSDQILLPGEEQEQRKPYRHETITRHVLLFLRSKIQGPCPGWFLMLLQASIVHSTVSPLHHLLTIRRFPSILFLIPALLIPSKNSSYPSRSV